MEQAMSHVNEWKADVGDGWHDLLDQMHAELVAADPGYGTDQVKEKFGTLRVYITPWDEPLHAIVVKYENLSASVCEWCGKPGTLDSRYFWRLTLCDDCKEKRAEKRAAEWKGKGNEDKES
jgi:hypothetical protein